ncbi:MAG: type II toxin-antitoxin system RelE/ParE family toxin [Desulfobacterales bacterium]|nr:type II toxin-antitoxin system RelE/ParE family toxin [Desulfobacterales bacterium]
MTWKIEFAPQAEKDLKKLDRAEAKRIIAFLRERVAPAPKAVGGRLKGQLREYRRYRVGDYRVLAVIKNERLLVLVVRVGHRKNVYS